MATAASSAPSGEDDAPRIAVVGTGVAALMCARTLAQLSRRAEQGPLRGAKIVLCTSRGKLATQMGPRNQVKPVLGKPYFDYGCQYFTADEAWFRAEVERLRDLGACQSLPVGQVGTVSAKEGFQPFPEASAGACWVGNGGMGPMLERLLEHTSEEFAGTVEHVRGFPDEGQKVVKLAKDPRTSKWSLGTKAGNRLGPFDFVVGGFAQHLLTDPFLLSGGAAAEGMLRSLRRVESNQIIAMQVAFEGEDFSMPFIAAHVLGEEALAWVCNNCAKPQQDGRLGTPGPAHLTLLSTAKFAEEQFQRNPQGYRRAAETQMLAALARVLGMQDLARFRPRVNRINHWEDGLPVNTPPASRGCLFDAEQGLGWCGDFCVTPGIQGAALSGQAMAQNLAAFLAGPAAFDKAGLLPADEAWAPIGGGEGGGAVLDMGAFARSTGLRPVSTHTDLVPSAIGGYDKAAQLGGSALRGGPGDARDGDARGGGRGKGKGKGPERRLAPDGNAYTKAEFKSFFGAYSEWDSAIGA